MPYVERDAMGAIIAVHAGPTPVAHEELPLGHRDLIEFLAQGNAGDEVRQRLSPAISTWRASPRT